MMSRPGDKRKLEEAAAAANAEENPAAAAVLVEERDQGDDDRLIFRGWKCGARRVGLAEVFDAYGRRAAALERHVPEIVLFLLYGTFLLTGSIVGFTSGLSGQRASFVTYVMVVLIVLLALYGLPLLAIMATSGQPVFAVLVIGIAAVGVTLLFGRPAKEWYATRKLGAASRS